MSQTTHQRPGKAASTGNAQRPNYTERTVQIPNKEALIKLYGKSRPMVEGGSELTRRIAKGDVIKELFVYAGDVRVFGEMPRGSNSRMAVLALPEGVSPSAVEWPVKGFEVLVVANSYGKNATRLLVAELFDGGAARVSVNTQTGNRIEHEGVYSQIARATQ